MPSDSGDGGAKAVRVAVEWMALRGNGIGSILCFLRDRLRQLEHVRSAREAIQGVLLGGVFVTWVGNARNVHVHDDDMQAV